MKVFALGVMNLTPNSFSDPGINLELEQFSKNLNSLRDNKVFCFDFGAESTAPKNAGLVDQKIEQKRFVDFLFPRLKFFNETDTFSIDTYRFETFLTVYSEIRKLYPFSMILWNDVSGVIDHELDKFLDQVLQDKNLKYVASFTYNVKRELSSFHKDRADENKKIIEDFIEMMFKYKKKFETITNDALIIDPAFGFSKTSEQNLELLDFFSHQNTSNLFTETEVMIGISKKSFLQLLCQKKYPELLLGSPELLLKTEDLHQFYLKKIHFHLKNQNLKGLYFRIHDPKVINFL